VEYHGRVTTTSAPTSARRDAAGEAWELLSELLRTQRARYTAIAAELELSHMQAAALKQIQPGSPLPMSALADALACDASNVTGIVDRLEARGLIERRGADHDRRVKTLTVTEKGADVRGVLLARLHEAPPEIRALSRTDQRALRDLLRRALAARAPAGR
jgi:MarR family transcriptional regulator, organic hydroperoxide resistance regulator